MQKQDITALRDEIILKALPNVVFDGWRWDVIEAASADAGYAPGTAQAVFPDRMCDVLDGFADLADRKMLAALAEINPEDLRVRDRVRSALLARYDFLRPHKEALRQSVQFWMVPTRKPRAAKIIWRTADRIWEWAGDTALDYNRYTKRGLLSGIIAASTLAWLADPHEDMAQTKAFIDRRIENVMQLGQGFGRVMGFFKKAS